MITISQNATDPLINFSLLLSQHHHFVDLMQNKSKAKWREIGGKKKYYRSAWEANYARYLDFCKCNKFIKDWFHEPSTFWFEHIKRGVRSYKPDFKVVNFDNTHYWVEVKGYFDSKSKTKIKRFKKYYPEEKIIVIDKIWFKNNKNLQKLCKGWE